MHSFMCRFKFGSFKAIVTLVMRSSPSSRVSVRLLKCMGIFAVEVPVKPRFLWCHLSIQHTSDR